MSKVFDPERTAFIHEMAIIPHPAVCEHVTKMGKLRSKQPTTKEPSAPAPRFRKLPIPRDLRFSETESPEETPRKSPEPQDETSVKTIRETESRQSYVEMKLGRNMRAAPKGGLASKHAPSSIHSQQLDREPLLHNQPLPSNNIVDYFTNTHCVQTNQSSQATTSKQYPSRSITSPQHPSQDLIEMLNRNNNTKLSYDVQSTAPTATAAEQLLVDKPLVDTTVNDIPKLDREQTFYKDTSEQSPVLAPPPSSFLYESLKVETDSTAPKPSDEGSTQPFTPQESNSYKTVTSVSSMTGFTSTDHYAVVNKQVTVEKQETIEEVDEIAEDIPALDDDDDNDDDKQIKDEDFNF